MYGSVPNTALLDFDGITGEAARYLIPTDCEIIIAVTLGTLSRGFSP
jgi:hypothetical protein